MVNTVGIPCSLNAFDCTLSDLVLFTKFGNFAGQHCSTVRQFRRGIFPAHLLDDFRPLRGKGFHLLGQTLAIVYDCLQRWKLVVVDKGVFCKDFLGVFPDALQFRAADAGLLFLG